MISRFLSMHASDQVALIVLPLFFTFFSLVLWFVLRPTNKKLLQAYADLPFADEVQTKGVTHES